MCLVISSVTNCVEHLYVAVSVGVYILIRIWTEMMNHFTSVAVSDHSCNRQAVELSVDCTCQQPVEVNGRH